MKKKNEKFIEEILLENYDKYYRIALTYTKNENDALDFVQESAYKAIFKAEKLKNTKYADTWICRIVMNEAIEYLRKSRKYHDDIEECNAEVEADYGGIEVREAMEKLALKDQMIVTLRYFEEMTLEEIANTMNENLSTIKSRLYRALRKLKVNLSDM